MNIANKILQLALAILCLVSVDSIQAKGGVKPPPPPPAPPSVAIPLEATLVPADGFHCGTKSAVSGETSASICYNSTGTIPSVYVYQRSGTVWKQQAKITGFEWIDTNSSLVLNGNTLAFSTPAAVYVYQRSTSATGVVTWSRQARIAAPAVDDNFGIGDIGSGGPSSGALALEGDTLVIGAWGSNTTAGAGSGAVYVYKRSLNTWLQSAKINGSKASEFFGISVAYNNGTLAVGVLGYYSGTTGIVSSFYVFQNPTGTTTWNRQAKINTLNATILGPTLDIDGNTLLVGSPDSFTHEAYVYQRVGTVWSLQAKLIPLGATFNEELFGSTVTLKGNVAVVGAATLSDATGKVFVYSRAGTVWTQKATLKDPNINELPNYGSSLDLSGNTLIVGSPGGRVGITNYLKGSSLVYRLPAL